MSTTLNAGYVNYTPLVSVYTGTGFNANNSVVSYEFADIAASLLADKTYIVIHATVKGTAAGGNSSSSGASLKLESKELGGSYSTDFDVNIDTDNSGTGSTYGVTHNSGQTITYYHALTSGERTNGIKLKMTGSAGAVSTLTNVQVVLSVITAGSIF